MKKKIVIFLMACALSASIATGCGGSTDKKEATRIEAAEEKNIDYASWSGKEWKEADEKQKKAAAEYYLVEVAKITAEAAGTEYTDAMKTSILTDEAVKTTISALDAGFATDETITVEKLIETATGLVNGADEDGIE